MVEALFRTAEWPAIPREDESVEIVDNLEAQSVESVGYDLDGYATVVIGRVVLDDLQAVQLRKAGWRVSRLCDGRAYTTGKARWSHVRGGKPARPHR